jgi:hypothetical protein
MRMAKHIVDVGEDRNAHRNLIGKHQGKKPLGRRGHGCENNIKMYLKRDTM